MRSEATAVPLPESGAFARLRAVGGRILPALMGNLVRFGSSFLLSKYMAVFHGPAGVALLGQFTNLSGILGNLSTGAIDNGIVRYVAESRRRGPDSLARVLSASTQIILVLSIGTFAGCVLFAPRIAEQLFYSADYYTLLVVLMGVGAVCQGVLAWMSGVLNGLGRLGSLGVLNMLAAGGTITVVSLAAFYGGIETGTLLTCLAFTNVPALAYASWRLRACRQELAPWRIRRLAVTDYTQFFRYSVMSGAAAVMTPLCTIAVRSILVTSGGLAVAGVFEGINRLSTAYLSLITTTLAMYYLPRLSALTLQEQRGEMRAMLRLVVPGVTVIALLVWMLREQLFTLVYSRDFVVSGQIMFFQLAGDCIKMTSWVLAYQLIARGMVGTFLVAELTANALRLATTVWWVPILGLSGGVLSYAATNTAYLAGMFWIFRDQFKHET